MTSQIDLSSNRLCGVWEQYDEWSGMFVSKGTYNGEGIKAIADALRVNGSLTCCNVVNNQMDEAAARLLVAAVKDKRISLCGIKPDQTEADFSDQRLKPADAILLASDLSQAGVTASLTTVRWPPAHEPMPASTLPSHAA